MPVYYGLPHMGKEAVTDRQAIQSLVDASWTPLGALSGQGDISVQPKWLIQDEAELLFFVHLYPASCMDAVYGSSMGRRRRRKNVR